MSELGTMREKLVDELVGAEFTEAPSLDGIKALPALVVGPGLSWLDGTSEAGPGRVYRYSIEIHVVVNAQEPVGALADIEDHVELVLDRLPRHWRLDRVEQPTRETARSGELVTLASAMFVSTRLGMG